jgi:thiamine-phosphate pyrophosphorylase
MMTRCHPLPALWLISDARNDGVLEEALARLPRGSGFVFRHYHLAPAERRARFAGLARRARARGIVVILAGSMAQARRWGADGAYGNAGLIAHGAHGVRLVTAHSLRELRRAGRADAVLLSPVFATRSHVGAKGMGAARFRLMAAQAVVPVVALGGMDQARARRLQWRRWAAIDGLSPSQSPKDS